MNWAQRTPSASSRATQGIGWADIAASMPNRQARRSLATLGMTALWALFSVWLLAAKPIAAQYQQPWSGRGVVSSQASQATASAPLPATAAAEGVLRVGLTVSDMDRSIEFYTRVLDFKTLTDDEVVGGAYEQLQGVFGARLRVVRLRESSSAEAVARWTRAGP